MTKAILRGEVILYKVQIGLCINEDKLLKRFAFSSFLPRLANGTGQSRNFASSNPSSRPKTLLDKYQVIV